MTTDALFEAALNLPRPERARLARRLLDTLVDDEGGDTRVDEGWRAEIERRLAEVREGRVALEDTETVLRELEAELVSGRRRARKGSKPRTRSR